jgi:hypothetical protein
MLLFLEANSCTSDFDDCYEPIDEWDRADTSTEWEFGNITLGREPRGGSLTIEVGEDFQVGDLAYVTVAVWSDGDSFGHDACRNAEMFSVYKTYEEAEAAVGKLKTAPGVLNRGPGVQLGNGYKLAYAPWEGYFESLDRIEVVSGAAT